MAAKCSLYSLSYSPGINFVAWCKIFSIRSSSFLKISFLLSTTKYEKNTSLGNLVPLHLQIRKKASYSVPQKVLSCKKHKLGGEKLVIRIVKVM